MKRTILTLLAIAVVSAAGAVLADAPPLPKWIDSAAGLDVPVDGAVETASFQYPGAEPHRVDIVADPASGSALLKIPPSINPQPGIATLTINMIGGESRQLEIPVSYYLEIDISGPAAASLFTPLPDEEYLVDYIPCCNIYGGLLIAERVPVNPTDVAAGLPERLLSDFVRLEPDGLTASTMGLYFEFGYDTELPADHIGLYEFGVNEWREVFDYTVNPEKRRIRFHCPNGGTFVVGQKSGTPDV